MGIFFAFLALLFWGGGDFLIQKSARKFGNWLTLFYITAFGSIILLPFVYSRLGEVFSFGKEFWFLLLVSVVILLAALLDFEALRVGKISVVEPVYALEIPVTILLASLIIGEYLSGPQLFLVVVLLVGIFLVSVKSLNKLKRFRLERGVLLAVVATVGMGLANFLFGFGARETGPLLVNWFTSLVMALVALIYLVGRARAKEIFSGWKREKLLIVGTGLIDNLAWISFTCSTLYIPIAITTSISESYIALASALGLFFNREKLKKHQWLGLILAVVAVVVLAIIT
ncbi:MAG: EamA family transporter [Patescibacteria group bacterium]